MFRTHATFSLCTLYTQTNRQQSSISHFVSERSCYCVRCDSHFHYFHPLLCPLSQRCHRQRGGGRVEGETVNAAVVVVTSRRRHRRRRERPFHATDRRRRGDEATGSAVSSTTHLMIALWRRSKPGAKAIQRRALSADLIVYCVSPRVTDPIRDRETW